MGTDPNRTAPPPMPSPAVTARRCPAKRQVDRGSVTASGRLQPSLPHNDRRAPTSENQPDIPHRFSTRNQHIPRCIRALAVADARTREHALVQRPNETPRATPRPSHSSAQRGRAALLRRRRRLEQHNAPSKWGGGPWLPTMRHCAGDSQRGRVNHRHALQECRRQKGAKAVPHIPRHACAERRETTRARSRATMRRRRRCRTQHDGDL